MVRYNNYQFWNYRAMRQYLTYLITMEASSENTHYLFGETIMPYVETIQSEFKVKKLLREMRERMAGDNGFKEMEVLVARINKV